MKRISIGLLLCLSCFLGIARASEDPPGVSFIHPSPSPDGVQVVFESDLADPNGPLNLWISKLDGTNLHKVTSGAALQLDPAWSPGGSRIAYATGAPGALDIWTIAPDGSAPVQLTKQSLNNTAPAWSPDGTLIVFVSNRGGTNDLWIMNADGSGQRRLTSLPGQENHPSFSPDGKSVVFSETVNGLAQLFVVAVAGSAPPAPITPFGYNDWNPDWSSHGIVFASNRDTTSEHWKIWTVQSGGSQLVRLGDVVALDPAWTSTGQVLFSNEIGGPANASSRVTLLNSVTGLTSVVAGVNGYLASIDIISSVSPPAITPGAPGQIRVAILSTTSFAAPTKVDPTSLTFGRTGTEKSLIGCDTSTSDVNHDGLPDLVCTFDLVKAAFVSTDTKAVLNFVDIQGIGYEGSEAIVASSNQGCSGTVLIDYSKGFSGSGLTFNGGASVLGNSLQLTDGKPNQAGSAFFSTEVPIAGFATDFSFQLLNAQADGFAFVAQANSPKALGGSGGGLGYSGIPNSVALKFDLFNNAGEGSSSTGLYIDGAFPAQPSFNLLSNGLDLHSGHIFIAHIAYDGKLVRVTITDSVTSASVSISDAIPEMSRNEKLFFGFTGATGRFTATQNILSWTFTNTATCAAN